MSVYLIGQIDIADKDEYQKYTDAFRSTFASVDGRPVGGFKGEVIARDENAQLLEGVWPFSKTIIMRFDSKEDAMAWYQSPAYRAIAKIRYGCAKTNLVLAQGCA